MTKQTPSQKYAETFTPEMRLTFGHLVCGRSGIESAWVVVDTNGQVLDWWFSRISANADARVRKAYVRKVLAIDVWNTLTQEESALIFKGREV